MRAKTLITAAFLLLAASGCTEEKMSWLVSPGHLADGATVDLGSEPDVETADSAVQKAPTGDPCTADDECFTGSCFCKEGVKENCYSIEDTVKGFNPQSTWEDMIPGGMCSKFMCDPKKSEIGGAECGPGAYCFNVEPLFGIAIGLCLKYCEDFDDCRYQEGYVCYYTGVEGQRGCLPAKMVADITCGDGKCDGTETADNCPRDCQ